MVGQKEEGGVMATLCKGCGEPFGTHDIEYGDGLCADCEIGILRKRMQELEQILARIHYQLGVRGDEDVEDCAFRLSEQNAALRKRVEELTENCVRHGSEIHNLELRVDRLINAVTCAEDYLKGQVRTSVEHLLVVLEKAKGE